MRRRETKIYISNFLKILLAELFCIILCCVFVNMYVKIKRANNIETKYNINKTTNAIVPKYDIINAKIKLTEQKQINDYIEIDWNKNWKFADYSMIHSSSVKLYKSQKEQLKNKIVCINAGHGTKGGTKYYTLCHPDGSPKVTGGSTGKGAKKATSINSGTVMADGTNESVVTLKLALIVKEALLNAGYDVLMIREKEDAQIDNIGRTIFANNNADCHISLHYDGTETDSGMFYISVPDVKSYKDMEPVRSYWKQHNLLGNALILGAKKVGVKVKSPEYMAIDLTQTSYSLIPSVDLEVGDKKSDYSELTQKQIANGIVLGLDIFYGFSK